MSEASALTLGKMTRIAPLIFRSRISSVPKVCVSNEAASPFFVLIKACVKAETHDQFKLTGLTEDEKTDCVNGKSPTIL